MDHLTHLVFFKAHRLFLLHELVICVTKKSELCPIIRNVSECKLRIDSDIDNLNI